MRNRELERKFELKGMSFEQASEALLEFYLSRKVKPVEVLVNTWTLDLYWLVPGRADFLRLRESKGEDLIGSKTELNEMTVKQKDRGCNFDRLEINTKIEDPAVARLTLEQALGENVGFVRKDKETIIFAEEGLVISLMTVRGSAGSDGLYLEVEAPEVAPIDKHTRLLKKLFKLKRVEESFFELFIEREVADVG